MAEDKTDAPLRTAPEALLHLLQTVDGNDTYASSWQAALRAGSWEEVPFSCAHVHVLELWRQTGFMVQSAPSHLAGVKRGWARYERLYWDLIVGTQSRWHVNNELVGEHEAALDQLHTITDSLSLVYGSSPRMGSTQNYLDGLRSDVSDLTVHLDDAPVPVSLRLRLREVFNEVTYTLDNAAVFGKAPIERTAYEMAGRSQTVGEALGSERPLGFRFLTRAKSVLSWVTLLDNAVGPESTVGGLVLRSAEDLRQAVEADEARLLQLESGDSLDGVSGRSTSD